MRRHSLAGSPSTTTTIKLTHMHVDMHTHVDIHMQKLKERQQRKTITRDYNLVPTFLGKDKKEKEEMATHKVTKE
ncbi:unnamed protein product [Rangifer tarandus platyrhynchus]|uniref:Uncharacterized protein n=2 Tax=Rangifer tarandus platyrhynchus TaxID=3082113 RepID=A0ACB0FD01_RANTA|nr:unnamed protein product [Rangifer tarandus platyrhynchus]CAI9710617.1 unnamed protein product [Rangifer tarandus platyrhynchus]